MKTNFINIVLLAIIFSTIFSCTKENIEEPPPSPSPYDNIKGRKIRYTVQVVPSGNTSFKSTLAADSAIVSLVMNDSIYSIATDTTGLATFNNLAAGTAAVNIRFENHTTVNLIVDLSIKTDSVIDSNNLRNAATMVALFPLTGVGTATISGKAFADLNTDVVGLENAPTEIQVSSIIESSQLTNYTNHTGSGQILSLSYEQSINSTELDANSEYQINVPASGSGLKIVVKANDFEYEQIVGGNLQRKIFIDKADTISVISGFRYYNDIIYN